MAKYRVILTAKNVDNCPLYEANERTVVNLPEVDTGSSDKVCGFILAELLRKRLQRQPNMICEMGESTSKSEYEEEFDVTDGILRCPLVASEVTFNVEIKAQADYIVEDDGADRTDTREIISKLRQIPILSTISPNNLVEMLSKIRVKKYQNGDLIIKQGEKGRYLYIVHRGKVEILQSSDDGKESVIAELNAGECFGEMSLLTNDPISSNIRSSGDTTILLVGKQDFYSLMHNNSQMQMMMTKLLAERIKSTNQKMETVVSSGMVGKLQAIGIPELVQTLCSTESTGILHIEQEKLEGKIYYQMGQILDVTVGQESGAECFYEMLKWVDGTFRFEKKEQIERQRTIMCDVTGLLLEGMRRIDENSAEFFGV